MGLCVSGRTELVRFMTTPTNGFAFMRAPAALSKAYDASPVALATAMEFWKTNPHMR
jgi:hypothetical protein